MIGVRLACRRRTRDVPGLTLDVLQLTPPAGTGVGTVVLAREGDTPFPVSTLTLDGPVVEFVGVADKCRRKGIVTRQLAFGCKLRGRPLMGDLPGADEGKALIAAATARGLLGLPRDEDDR